MKRHLLTVFILSCGCRNAVAPTQPVGTGQAPAEARRTPTEAKRQSSAEAKPAPRDATTAAGAPATLEQVLDLFALKRLATLDPMRVRDDLSWLGLREQAKTPGAWVFEAAGSGVVEKAEVTFAISEGAKGWMPYGTQITLARTFGYGDMMTQLRKRYGKPKWARSDSTGWMIGKGWAVEVMKMGDAVVISAGPNADIGE